MKRIRVCASMAKNEHVYMPMKTFKAPEFTVYELEVADIMIAMEKYEFTAREIEVADAMIEMSKKRKVDTIVSFGGTASVFIPYKRSNVM